MASRLDELGAILDRKKHALDPVERAVIERRWRENIAHDTQRAKNTWPEKAAEFDAEAQELIALGPDWRRINRRRKLMDAPKVTMTQARRERIWSAFHAALRKLDLCESFRSRRSTHALRTKAVLKVLLRHASRFEKVYPSIPWIAAEVGCSRWTVMRALEWLERHRLITRYLRRARYPGALQIRERNTSNAYLIHPPKEAPCPEVAGWGSLSSKLQPNPRYERFQKEAGAIR